MSTTIRIGDVREILPALPEKSVHCVITSPPYYRLRDYGHAGQFGIEKTPEAFLAGLLDVFMQVHRILRDDGSLWLNIGDTAGPNKNMLGIPWRLALALQQAGWILRQEIIWNKPNAMPAPAKDRFVTAHEHVFLLTKKPKYHFDFKAVQEDATCDRLPGRGLTNTKKTYGAQNGGNEGLRALRNRLNDQGHTDDKRNRRTVWTISTKAISGAHFAVFPEALVEPCLLAGCPEGGTVLDPFFGSGTTALVAERHGRNAIGIELNADYAKIARRRLGEANKGGTVVVHRDDCI